MTNVNIRSPKRSDQAELVKIAFTDDDGQVETLWAFDLGGGRYRLDSTPWFQYGVSWKDVVAARPDSDGLLCFTQVLEKSGYRTVRVAFEERTGAENPILSGLQSLGCSFEGGKQPPIRNRYSPRGFASSRAGFPSLEQGSMGIRRS